MWNNFLLFSEHVHDHCQLNLDFLRFAEILSSEIGTDKFLFDIVFFNEIRYLRNYLKVSYQLTRILTVDYLRK